MNFGQRLRFLRTKKKISQKNLGIVLGMSQENISFYENSKREPDISTLKKIAEFFGVSLDYLLVLDTSYLKEANDITNTITQHDLYGLSDEEIADIKKYIEFVRSKSNSI
jgi:transcriptional regulator with XRE-family HTH domain